jgi:hypothetical protein
VTARIERLRARLARPLLVSNPVNVRYLTGVGSRYAEAARAVADVELVETRRDLYADLAALRVARSRSRRGR